MDEMQSPGKKNLNLMLCMDESDRQHKMNKKRLQLYMKHVYQTYDLQGQAGSKKDCGQERNEKRSIDGYLSDMDNV